MSRPLAEVFTQARQEGRSALIGYLPAGFPTAEQSVDLITAMVEGGVDIIEVGLPYSDPLMDGPDIQSAVERALRGGATTDVVLDVVRQVGAAGVTALVMSYWNPIERYGVDRFAERLAAAGGHGVITPDLTPEEAGPWIEATTAHALDRVFLVAPSSTDTRIAQVASVTSGFLYAASTMGVTGARTRVSSAAPELVARARLITDLPICVGLGVSTGAQAAEVARYADGVIVGSAFVRRILQAETPQEARRQVVALAEELAAGVRGG
ncbi:MAG TPA: tryptophan synthase subunit alpha [Actinobacteria bacterium]|nr:tryptophan synthase subunit alpha [Actinomycetota bacterium]